MAWDLEGLIGDLLIVISCGGEKGCTVNDLTDAIRQELAAKSIGGKAEEESVEVTQQDKSQHDPPDPKAVAAVWGWLFARQDVSLGPGRKYNHLSLTEVEAQRVVSQGTPEVSGDNGSTFDVAEASSRPSRNGRGHDSPDDMRATLEADTMWECLTGHSVDYARVPRSEWDLIRGIATTVNSGILQGDLCRLTGQDKRSVPKRTDSLVRKGYITKRTVLVKGTKTSKIWLNRFCPRYVEQKERKQQHSASGMNLDPDFLKSNRDAVPWNYRWTGDTIDYVALATTIVAIVKSWGVIRVCDLKLKLGITDLRWQMKVAAKTFRFLHTRGCAQFVGAMLDDRLFKDCLKFIRDMDDPDWEAYLAVGKRGSAGAVTEDGAYMEPPNASVDPELLAARPPRSLDEPLTTYIARTARSMDGSQLTHTDVCSLTTGPAFMRYLMTLLASMAESVVQPARLKHYQMKVEHVRTGKIACFKYSIPAPNPEQQEQPASQPPGFSELPAKYAMHAETADLSVLCKSKAHLFKCTRGVNKLVGALGSSAEGRAYLAKDEDLQETAAFAQPIVTLKVNSEAFGLVMAQPIPSEQGDITDPLSDDRAGSGNMGASQEPEKSEEPAEADESDPANLADKTTVDHDVQQPAELAPPALEAVESSETQPAAEETTAVAASERIADDPLNPSENSPEPSSRGGRGRGNRGGRGARARGRGRGRGRAGASSTDEKPWKCEKCGGAWKNDIGLKYHLEKAKVPCNTSYDPSAELLRQEKAREELKRAKAEEAQRRQEAKEVKRRESAARANATLEASTNSPNSRSKNRGKTVRKGDQTEDQTSISEDDDTALLRPRTPGLKKQRTGYSQKVSGPRRPKLLHRTQEMPNTVSIAGSSALLPIGDLQVTRSADVVSISARSTGMGSVIKPTNGGELGELSSPSQTTETNWAENHNADVFVKSDIDMLDDNGHGAPAELPVSTSGVRGMSQTAWHREKYRRFESLLRVILAENHGYFPGGDALWRALRIAWVKEFSYENCPTNRQFKAVLSGMLRNKTVAEHSHAWKAPNGTFATVKIVSLPDEDPFSPSARAMLALVKAKWPEVWLPEHTRAAEAESLRVNGEIVHSRRALPKEVVELAAPVYAKQLAAKRKWHDERIQDGTSQRGKRRKPRVLTGSPGGRRGKHGEMTGMYRFHTMSARYTPLEVQQMANFSHNRDLEFLDPNTGLEDDNYPRMNPRMMDGTTKKEKIMKKKASARSQMFDKYGIHQQPHILMDADSSNGVKIIPPYSIASTSLGGWPDLDPVFFERVDGSFTLQNPEWWPDRDWFTWNSITNAIDKTASAQASRGWFKLNETDNEKRRFKDRLVGAARVEMAWGDAFLTARPGAAGPHNTFIHFFSNPNIPNSLGVLSWPEDGQYDNSYLGSIEEEIGSGDSSDHDSEFEEAVSVRLRRRKVFMRGRGRGRGRPRGSRKIFQERELPAPPSAVKSVELKKRRLTPLPPDVTDPAGDLRDTWDIPAPDKPEELMAGIIAVRSLMGGVDRLIDWGFLLYLFPNLSLSIIKKFWRHSRQTQKSYIMQLARSFQEAYITACESEELPMLDYDNPKNYDWPKLIEWTMQISNRSDTQIPSTVEELDESFTLKDIAASKDDWRERFFHFQTSTYTRLELATAIPGAKSISTELSNQTKEEVQIGIDEKSRSWIRALCCTNEADYTAEAVKAKLLTLGNGNNIKAKALLEKAIARLILDKVIHGKRSPGVFDSKPYRLMEPYLTSLGRLANWDKYKQAAEFKGQLDRTFRSGQNFKIPYTISEGAIVALLNLNAHGRVAIKGLDIPHIPFGFVPGNYESRKQKKELYHFGVEIAPTATYQFTEDVPAVWEARSTEPPNKGPGGSLPQWCDFFGRYNIHRWTEILAAVCFAYSTRGHMPITILCQHMRPILEPFEARVLLEWGKRTGVLEDSMQGCVTVGEWWWLAVPMMKQHPAF